MKFKFKKIFTLLVFLFGACSSVVLQYDSFSKKVYADVLSDLATNLESKMNVILEAFNNGYSNDSDVEKSMVASQWFRYDFINFVQFDSTVEVANNQREFCKQAINALQEMGFSSDAQNNEDTIRRQGYDIFKQQQDEKGTDGKEKSKTDKNIRIMSENLAYFLDKNTLVTLDDAVTAATKKAEIAQENEEKTAQSDEQSSSSQQSHVVGTEFEISPAEGQQVNIQNTQPFETVVTVTSDQGGLSGTTESVADKETKRLFSMQSFSQQSELDEAAADEVDGDLIEDDEVEGKFVFGPKKDYKIDSAAILSNLEQVDDALEAMRHIFLSTASFFENFSEYVKRNDLPFLKEVKNLIRKLKRSSNLESFQEGLDSIAIIGGYLKIFERFIQSKLTNAETSLRINKRKLAKVENSLSNEASNKKSDEASIKKLKNDKKNKKLENDKKKFEQKVFSLEVNKLYFKSLADYIKTQIAPLFDHNKFDPENKEKFDPNTNNSLFSIINYLNSNSVLTDGLKQEEFNPMYNAFFNIKLKSVMKNLPKKVVIRKELFDKKYGKLGSRKDSKGKKGKANKVKGKNQLNQRSSLQQNNLV